jgi:hypothetical protein
MEENKYARVVYGVCPSKNILKKDFLNLLSSVRWKYGLHKIDEIEKENGREFINCLCITAN